MQVSEQKDFVTHAVIGGGQTIDFGISNSAEFFNILSSTLYKDQILAVVREVLCNAWDAHIEAGCTDKPVEITLTDDKFVIKDFGKGIHRDDMGLIYGTYGNSTKKNDGKQTGGFGLGCKAPFAYTDHFEVQSNHDHVRTIYNLSKSSAQAQGKPGIVPIASFPSLETGLQVSIPVLNSDDHRRFRHLIRRIVRNGDMNMKLNGEQLPRLGFDTSAANVMITLDESVIDNQTRIMVRYGNVIYPVDKANELANLYSRIVDHLHKMSHYDRKYSIIFQAPPHSIAVTPSRESLSMQGHTTKTLTTLFSDFLTMVAQDFPLVCDEFAIAAVDEAVKEERIDNLLDPEGRLPIKKANAFVPSRITDLITMARRFMETNYPQDIQFRKRDIAYRLKEMVKAKQLDRGLVQTYLRALDTVAGHGTYNRQSSDWLQKHVIGRLAGKLIKSGLLVDKLYVFDPEDQNAPRGYNRGKAEVPIVHASKVCPQHLFNTLPYLRNIVVLATSTHNLGERCKKHDVFKKLGASTGFVFYHVGLKKSDREQAVAFFQTTGMQVVDLTFKQEWEIEKYNGVPVTLAPRKKAKKGVACLTSVLADKGSIYLSNFMEEDAARIENPEFMVEVSLRNDVSKHSLGYDWNGVASRYVVDLFGDKGGITNNSAIMEKWLATGAKKMIDYVQEKVCLYMTTSPTIQEYWQYNFDRVQAIDGMSYSSLHGTIYGNKKLRAEYGLVDNLTEEDKKYMCLWDVLVNKHYRYSTTPAEVLKVKEHLKNIPIHQANLDLVKKFKGNRLLNVINDHGLSSIINKGSPTEAEEAIALLNRILNK
jgi:hypothetical protein